MDGNNVDVVKEFIAAVKEYKHQRTEAISQKLQRYLQMLSATPDNSIFDPNMSDGTEMYVCLHDLMSGLDSRSGLMWCAVNVLEEAGKVSAAQYALVHTFKFTPILTQLLSAHLIHDKRIKVLRLLQNFTYGIKILWQDAYLPLLISTLIKWVTDYGNDNELVSLSLGVLVNLCYKNLPAVYTLRRIIDVKEFLQAILGQPKDVLEIRVQSYKLLVILEELEGEMPDTEILAGVKWTFKRLLESFDSRSFNIMRHLVDYFKDIQCNSNFKKVLLTYPRYRQDTEVLIKQLEKQIPSVVTESSECVAVLLEFLQSLVELQLPDMEVLYEPITTITLNLAGTNIRIGKSAFQIIRTIIIETQRNGMSGQESICKQAEEALPVLLSLMNERYRADYESRSWMTDLLALLLEMSKVPQLCNIIASTLSPLMMKQFFIQILSPEESENIFNHSLTAFYIQGVSLVFSLAQISEAWQELCSKLLQHKKLQMRFAAALFTGSKAVKLQVLQLIAQLSNDSSILFQLSQCMTELGGIVLSAGGLEQMRNTGFSPASVPVTSDQNCVGPLFTVAQQGRLDHCINKVQQAITNNELSSVGTAAVLELYQYRVAAMSQTESVLQSNLQAVESHCTQLRHRLAVMTSETSRLLSLLHSKEQSLENVRSSINNLQGELRKMENSFQSTRNHYAQSVQDLKSKGIIIDQMSKEIEAQKQNIKVHKEENEKLTEEIQQHLRTLKQDQEDNKRLKETISRINTELDNREESIKMKSKEIKDLKDTLESREKKISQKDTLIKGLEKSICDKDNEIVHYQSEIAELESMRDVIIKITKETEKKKK